MQITFIAPTVNISGGSRVIAIYAKALMQFGHKVCIISQPPRSPSTAQKIKSLLKCGRLPDPSSTHFFINGNIDHRVLDRPRPITNDDVPDGDVVVATWWRTAEWVNALHASKGAKVYFIQGHEIFPYLPVERCHATYRMRLHKIVVSSWLKRVMNAEYGDSVVDIVPNSVDRQQFFANVRSKQSVTNCGVFIFDRSS